MPLYVVCVEMRLYRSPRAGPEPRSTPKLTPRLTAKLTPKLTAKLTPKLKKEKEKEEVTRTQTVMSSLVMTESPMPCKALEKGENDYYDAYSFDSSTWDTLEPTGPLPTSVFHDTAIDNECSQDPYFAEDDNVSSIFCGCPKYYE